MQLERRFDGRLRVKLGRERDLEQHVLHDVRAERTLERDRAAFEQHVLKTPALGRQGRRIAHLASACEQRVPHAAARRVAGRPALTRAGVRRVPIRSQRAAVEPRIRNGVDDLVAAAAEQARRHRRARDAHEQHVVETDAVEAVVQREHALDLVRLDHGREHVGHRERARRGGSRSPRRRGSRRDCRTGDPTRPRARCR